MNKNIIYFLQFKNKSNYRNVPECNKLDLRTSLNITKAANKWKNYLFPKINLIFWSYYWIKWK